MRQKLILGVLGVFIVFGFIWHNKGYVYYRTYFNGYYTKAAGTEEQRYESVTEINGLPDEIWEEEKKGDVLLKSVWKKKHRSRNGEENNRTNI